MAIYDYLPKFHVVEANNLKGLQPGFVVAQTPVKPESDLINKTHANMVENGQLAMIVCNADRESATHVEMDVWASAASSNPVMYLVYSEPINRLFESDKFYATNLEEELPRFVQLIPGDEWTTDIDYETFYSEQWAELKKHIVEITKGDDWYANATLADGTAAHHYMYIG